MNHPEILKTIHKKTGIHQNDVKDVIEAYLKLIQLSLFKNEVYRKYRFGTFRLQKIHSRKMLNINTGTDFIIPERYKIKFIPCLEFENLVKANNPIEDGI